MRLQSLHRHQPLRARVALRCVAILLHLQVTTVHGLTFVYHSSTSGDRECVGSRLPHERLRTGLPELFQVFGTVVRRAGVDLAGGIGSGGRHFQSRRDHRQVPSRPQRRTQAQVGRTTVPVVQLMFFSGGGNSFWVSIV